MHTAAFGAQLRGDLLRTCRHAESELRWSASAVVRELVREEMDPPVAADVV